MKNTLSTVHKALQVLQEISNDINNEVSVSNLAERLGYPKSVTHRLVTSLVQDKFLEQDPISKKYSIGYRSFLVGIKYRSFDRLSSIAEPYIMSMIAELNKPCSSYIGVLDDTDVVFLSVFFASKPIRIESAKQGEHRPVHTTALGKSILAKLSTNEFNSLVRRIEFTPMTSNTIVDIDRLQKEIDIIKQRGYAIADQESLEGVTSVGAAIAPSRLLLSGFSISIPSIIVTKDLIMTLGNAIQVTANKIEQAVRDYYLI
jgi:DNA-binding IclR family transcriptional regulator